MTTKVSPLGLRLFMEGVEVPVISASVSVQPDMPATASIQVIPTDMGLHLLPRTLVHLFYLDAYLTDKERDEALKLMDTRARTRASVTFEQGKMDQYDTQDFAYKIMFTGEVIGFNYKKTPVGRQLILQCMDLSSYWDTCYQFFSDYSAAGSGLTDKHHQFVGAGSGVFDNLGGHQWVISKLINSRPKSPEYQECEGLLGGLIHLLETVGGIRYRNAQFKGYKGVNDFFTIAELRYGLLSMLGAIKADKTSSKLYASKAFNQWIRNGMTSIGTLVSFRDMLNHINRYIFHNIYPNPCAHYVPGGTTTAKRSVKVGTTAVIDAVAGPGSKKGLKMTLTTLNKAIDSLKTVELAVTIRPIPDADRALRLADDMLVQEISIIDSSKTRQATALAADLREIRTTVRQAVTTMPLVPEGLQPTTFVEGSRGGDILEKASQARTLAEDASDKLDELLGKEQARFSTEEIEVPGASFLYNQLFLPEVFFVAPPRCNVIFPDQYYDLNFSRNFMREVTRLACQGGLGMLGGGRQGAQLFGRHYLAPNIKDTRGQLLSATFSQGARILLPHEVHSGIIPKFEWVTDGHRWGLKAAFGAGSLDKVKKTQKIHYLQRLANFQFFLHRWSARQLSITGVFNPYIVAGFPAVIIDRSSPSPVVVERLEKILRRRMLPTQFIGKVHSFTHQIGQDGGSTSIQFVYARTHRGLDDEFMGVLSREIMEEGESNTFEVHPREIATKGLDSAAVLDAQAKTFTGSGEGTFEELPESEESKKAKAKLEARNDKYLNLRKYIIRLDLDQKLKPNIHIAGLGKVKRVMKVGTTTLTRPMADALGISADYFDKNKRTTTTKEAGVQASIENLAGVDVIDVTEKFSILYAPLVGTGKFERSGEAFEDIVRPEWMSKEVWENKNITESVYKQLLGSLAITDDSGLGQEQQDELLKRWKTDQIKRIQFAPIEPGAAGSAGTASVETTADGKFKYVVVPGSIEETVDGISLVYGLIKEKGGDVHEFIRDFTKRPIATMVDILGTQNLEFNESGMVVDPTTMIEGFHSRAFGDYNTDVQLPEKQGSSTMAGKKAMAALMEGVADPASLPRPGMIGKDDKETGIRPELDPRGRARGRVIAYVEELQVSRGLLGS